MYGVVSSFGWEAFRGLEFIYPHVKWNEYHFYISHIVDCRRIVFIARELDTLIPPSDHDIPLQFRLLTLHAPLSHRDHHFIRRVFMPYHRPFLHLTNGSTTQKPGDISSFQPHPTMRPKPQKNFFEFRSHTTHLSMLSLFLILCPSLLPSLLPLSPFLSLSLYPRLTSYLLTTTATPG